MVMMPNRCWPTWVSISSRFRRGSINRGTMPGSRYGSSSKNKFLAGHPSGAAEAQATIFQSAVKMMHPEAASAFDLSQEKTKVRESYGKGTFGQGCLIARRLVERGVPFVEVTLGGNGLGWDTHQNNFNTVKRLSEELDQGLEHLND